MTMKIKALAILALGIVLIVLAFVIFSGGTDVVSIDANKLDSDANGKLVYVQGQLKPRGALEDQLFGIAERDAVALKRVVELYQYQQSESGELSPIWSDEIITLDSQSSNQPLTKWVESVTYTPNEYALGIYNLSSRLQEKVTASSWEPMPFTPEQYNALPSSGKRAFKLYEGKLYYGINPEEPRIGDMFISFERSIQNVSIVAQLSGGQLIPDTETGNNIHVIRNGSVSKDALIENLDLPGGLIRLIVLGAGFIVALLGGFLFLKSKASDANEMDDNEYAELDSDEFTTDDTALAGDLNDESDISENLDKQPQEVPDDLGAMAAEIASGAGIHSSHDDGAEHYSPMKTPSVEEEHHEEIEPLDDAAVDTSFSPEETPEYQAQVDDNDDTLAFDEPIAQEPQQVEQEDHFAVDDIDGLDFDFNDETHTQEPQESSVEVDSESNVTPNENDTHKSALDDFDTNFVDEKAPNMTDEDSFSVDEVQTDSPLDAEISKNEEVEPLSEDGFDNQSYEDDIDVSEEMFLLDEEQDEGGSEPQEVDSDEGVESPQTAFEPSANPESDLGELEETFTSPNTEQNLEGEFATTANIDSTETSVMQQESDEMLGADSSLENSAINESDDEDEDSDGLFLDEEEDDDFLFLDDEDESGDEDEDSDGLFLDEEDDEDFLFLDDEDESGDEDEATQEQVDSDEQTLAVEPQAVTTHTLGEDDSSNSNNTSIKEAAPSEDELDEFDGDWDFDDIEAVDDEDDESNKKNKDNSAVDIQEF